jgi:predicted nucleic acid-binding protein
LVKLYVDEPGHESVRSVDQIVISALAKVEVLSALWRKHRLAQIDAPAAARLVSGFEEDFFGTDDSDPRFRIVRVSDEILDAAARLTGTAGLRAYDAVQLASAEAARAASSGCDTFACFDTTLRDAAARSGFSLYPRE